MSHAKALLQAKARVSHEVERIARVGCKLRSQQSRILGLKLLRGGFYDRTSKKTLDKVQTRDTILSIYVFAIILSCHIHSLMIVLQIKNVKGRVNCET